MLSMLMTSTASEEGTFVIVERFDGNRVDVTVDYDATISVYKDTTTHNGNFDIEGTTNVDGKIYKSDFDASGRICQDEKQLLYLDLHVDGKLYQESETGYLHKDKDNDYYGYIESGYNAIGDVYFCKNTGTATGGDVLQTDFSVFDEYSKYVITNTIPREKEKDDPFTLSSPALGLGYKGSKMGDVIPALFTYRDSNTRKRVVTETYPVDHDGPVICTPARIAGEPLIPSNFWTTPKVLRELEWKVNGK